MFARHSMEVNNLLKTLHNQFINKIPKILQINVKIIRKAKMFEYNFVCEWKSFTYHLQNFMHNSHT